MDRLDNVSKIKAHQLFEELKVLLKPLFQKHMDDIMSGHFSSTMIIEWHNDDKNLLIWRAATENTAFEKSTASVDTLSDQPYFDHGVAIVAFIKSGVELAFETMVASRYCGRVCLLRVPA